MVSTAANSLFVPKRSLKDLMERGHEKLISKINQLKEEIEADQLLKIKEKLGTNQRKLWSHTQEMLQKTFALDPSSMENMSCDVPRLESKNSLCLMNGFCSGSADKDITYILEVPFLKSTKLPRIQSIPPYTTWIFLAKNQRMAEDQSIIGRRRIYYDQSDNEALVCSESDDDIVEVEEEKHDFSEGEDRILWMAFQEHGLNDDVTNVISHFIGGNSAEIQERYNELKQKANTSQEHSGRNMFLEKSLSAALDSFDNLFCRRCLVFDCRLHGCSQNLIYPSDKPLGLSESEVRSPCSDQCYLLVRQTTDGMMESADNRALHQMNQKGENKGSKVSSFKDKLSNDNVGKGHNLESAAGEGPSRASILPVAQHANVAKRRITDENDRVLEGFDGFEKIGDKKLKKVQALEFPVERPTRSLLNAFSSSKSQANDSVQGRVVDNCTKLLSSSCEWKTLEKDLYLKGIEIFGRNSCLIARNLLSGLKTCSEVSIYMHNNRALMGHGTDIVCSSKDKAGAESADVELDTKTRLRSKLFRKRGRTRRLKYSSKSNGHPSSWKRVDDEKKLCKQYIPCTCQFMCGKDCFCLKIGTCCEKYCGCSKSCKNRFRGCHCAKSQCRTRQCPCFAADRECDPDVCRNCWVSCGGGSLGEPPKRGEGQCGNMNLLLRQRQRVLLGRSDVAGWGAFIKNAVNKNDYLGEYTGELVSHREADKRGKIYDLANSSYLFDLNDQVRGADKRGKIFDLANSAYLFNLNDQYVLDAFRQGDKLKFANHSENPNCFCKVMLVAGDHRVGIFAKERIEAEEELFYDYCYTDGQKPAWAKKDDNLPSQGRPRKHQSR
ncbi:histone-lysine N-methyltransferase EZ3 isoform X1 [Amaranthus tricolor]|uniref:histone-lysine N-methyltransferase EZ3 isoform X1 n=1 Tax=Amaranthus tricolor TaxID=29722 RepID=UPI002584FA76|nr:histone-lysine N-methyltransferase EZ3 isoform X1 [Amaranthus tricolor]